MRGDIAEVQTAEGKLHLFVAIDRTSKFGFVRLEEKANRIAASAFLVALIKAVPNKIHTVLTERAIGSAIGSSPMARGIQFTLPPRYADGPTAAFITHMCDMRCKEHGIEHRLTKIKHPWSREDQKTVRGTVFPRGGQVERSPLMVCMQTTAGQRNDSMAASATC